MLDPSLFKNLDKIRGLLLFRVVAPLTLFFPKMILSLKSMTRKTSYVRVKVPPRLLIFAAPSLEKLPRTMARTLMRPFAWMMSSCESFPPMRNEVSSSHLSEYVLLFLNF
jgi:hypothetical protein